MEITAEVLVAAVTTIGGGAAAFWGWLKSRDASADTQRAKFYDTLLSEVQDLRNECRELRNQIDTLETNCETFKSRLEFYEENTLAVQARQMLSHVMNNQRHPAWIHHVGENKWYLNDAYCEQFGVIRPSFWTPVNIFARYSPDDALQFIRNDLAALESGVACTFKERVHLRIMDPDCTDIIEATFIKAPLAIGDSRYVIGEMTDGPPN